jgi:hypothetical protein
VPKWLSLTSIAATARARLRRVARYRLGLKVITYIGKAVQHEKEAAGSCPAGSRPSRRDEFLTLAAQSIEWISIISNSKLTAVAILGPKNL